MEYIACWKTAANIYYYYIKQNLIFRIINEFVLIEIRISNFNTFWIMDNNITRS